MASDSYFVEYVVEQISPAGDIICKKMFGEYGLYCDGKFFGMICDDKFFVKPTATGKTYIGTPTEAPPYPGAKNCFLIEEQLEDSAWLSELVRLTAAALPEPKPKKKKK